MDLLFPVLHSAASKQTKSWTVAQSLIVTDRICLQGTIPGDAYEFTFCKHTLQKVDCDFIKAQLHDSTHISLLCSRKLIRYVGNPVGSLCAQ